VPIAQNFVDNWMPSPEHWSKSECCAPFLRYREHKKFAGIEIGIVGHSCLCGRFCTNLVGCKIRPGVIRGSRVVGRVLRVFLVTWPDANSDVRIACQYGYRQICQVSSGRQNSRFGWINKHE
jgi:hypothetical protein